MLTRTTTTTAALIHRRLARMGSWGAAAILTASGTSWTCGPESRLAGDRSVVTSDISGVVARFGTIRESTPTKQEALAEALTQPTDLTSYHTAFDRSGVVLAANPWNLRPPDGSITTSDISAVVAQFGHSCA